MMAAALSLVVAAPVAALALVVAAPVAAQAGDALAGLPGLTVTFYDVDGQDAAAVRAAMNAVRPTDRNDGERVDALSHWTIRWRWAGHGRGGCNLRAATVRVRAAVMLPRLAHPETVPAPLLARWDRYRRALEAHEAGHVRYAYDHRAAVLAAIRGATCATAAAAARAALAAIKAHDIDYDRDTDHGRRQGAVFP